MRRPSLHLGRVPRLRSAVSVIVVLMAVSAAAPQLLGGLAAAGAGPIAIPWPRCAPLCKHAPAHGPRVTAIYLSTQERHGRPVVTIDAFVAAIRARSVIGQLCYEAHHLVAEPGCGIVAITHGRRVGAGVWWLRFQTRVPAISDQHQQLARARALLLVRCLRAGRRQLRRGLAPRHIPAGQFVDDDRYRRTDLALLPTDSARAGPATA